MANKVVAGWVWEQIEGQPEKYWHIKKVDESKGTVKLQNVEIPSKSIEREIGQVADFGKTRPKRSTDKKRKVHDKNPAAVRQPKIKWFD